MQALKSLFSRTSTPAVAVPALSQPVPISAEQLKLVGGGLPRVGEAAIVAIPSASVTTGLEELPRVG